ncbi:MAG: histidinol-phosphate transaminase [Phycisphaerae bacterium]|nr:histidinol-phosphate transaminase [Phycisphaerae bacterium]
MNVPIRKHITLMQGYTPGEQPADVSVVKLNTNENPYPPSPRVLSAINAITAEQLRRYPSPDAGDFRQAAAAVHHIDPEMILPTNGGDELLALVVRACAGENARVAYLDPGYSLYPVLANMQAAIPVPVPYEISAQEWRIPRDIWKIDAAVLLIVNPNAPSGTLIGLSALEDIARRFSGLLLIDEAYVDFAPTSALGLVPQFPNLILLRSMSKGYGLAGMRFGYGIAQAPLIAELYKVRDSYPCDVIAIAAATAAIGDQAYAKAAWQKVLQQRQWMTNQLVKLGFGVPESHSNFVLAQVPAGMDAATLYQHLKSRNILVRYFNLPRLTDKLRITIGTPQQNEVLVQTLIDLKKGLQHAHS